MTALRRADWRFLLPAPDGDGYHRLVLFGGSDDLLARLGSVASDRSRGPAGVETADLVVVMADADQPIESVLSRVSETATVHIEVNRRRARTRWLTPARLRHALERHRLTPVACHWVIPDPEHARRHIPLDAAPAIDWYLGTMQTARSPRTVVVDAGIRLLARAGPPMLARWVPSYSMTAIGSARRRAPVGVLAPVDAPVAMITSGQDDGSRVVLLPFETERPMPSRVVKVSRLTEFEGHTEREQRTLAELRRRLPDRLGDLVPEPLGTRRWQGLLVANESYAPGAPLVVTSGRYGAGFVPLRADLRHAIDWLIEFHRATATEDRWSGQWAGRSVARFDACRALFPPGSATERLLDLAAAAARRLIGAPVPIVLLHNDLGPWNMHRDGARVTAIDWELGDGDVSDRAGPGPCDLFYFVTCWYLQARHRVTPKEERAGLRELFTRPGSGGRVADAALQETRRYAAALGVAGELLPVLLVATWVERALDWMERAQIGRTQAPSIAENRYARYLEVLAERAGPWFEEGRWP